MPRHERPKRQTTHRKKRERDIAPEVWAVIEAMQGESGPKIERYLRTLAERGELAAVVPPLRTIQRAMEDLRELANPETQHGKGDLWHLRDSSPEDARTILDVLRAVTILTSGKISTISLVESAMITRLSKAMPSASPLLLWRVARLYIAAESRDQDTARLDTFLAFQPWASTEAREKYEKYIADGLIVAVPLKTWLIGGPSSQSMIEFGSPDVSAEDIQSVTGDHIEVAEAWKRNWESFVVPFKELESQEALTEAQRRLILDALLSLSDKQRELLDRMERLLGAMDEVMWRGGNIDAQKQEYAALQKAYDFAAQTRREYYEQLMKLKTAESEEGR